MTKEINSTNDEETKTSSDENDKKNKMANSGSGYINSETINDKFKALSEEADREDISETDL